MDEGSKAPDGYSFLTLLKVHAIKKGALMDSMTPTNENLQNTVKQVCRLVKKCKSMPTSLFLCLWHWIHWSFPFLHVRMPQTQPTCWTPIETWGQAGTRTGESPDPGTASPSQFSQPSTPLRAQTGKHCVPAAVAALGAAAC